MATDLIAAIILTIWVLITGALHLDGLADSADAWVGGLNDRERTLEIMKDPYCGPIAVALIVLVLLLKWLAISHLLKMEQSAFLIVVPMLSRGVIVILFMTTLYVRDSGLGSAFTQSMPEEKNLWSMLAVCAISYWLFASYFSLILVVISVILLRSMMVKRIGGLTGDTVGATVELSETVALVALAL
jgi:adenosylcobinamide-GDP ribazoletransferase